MRLLPAEGSKIPAWRLGVTYAAMAGVLLTFLGRLLSLQILDGTTYLEAARENRITNVRLPAPRGVIYDRNGSPLVRNLPAYNVMVTPGYLCAPGSSRGSGRRWPPVRRPIWWRT